MFPDDLPPGLTSGEIELLADVLSDDVGFVWILNDLGIRDNPPPVPDWRPSWNDVDRAFASLEKLVDLGLIAVGNLERLPGQSDDVSPPVVRHVPENLIDVRVRVLGDVDEDVWEWSCWAVATPRLEEVARTPR